MNGRGDTTPGIAVLWLFATSACTGAPVIEAPQEVATTTAATTAAIAIATADQTAAWNELLAGVPASATTWHEAPFGGSGGVEIVDGALRLHAGSPMTGIVWSAPPLPSMGYELEVEAARRSGSDFFCGLTFPVGDCCLTLVLGGWGGATCGLSCLDGNDASSNETATYRGFQRGRRYRARVRVEPGRVRAWIDDGSGSATLADVATDGRRLSLRPEVLPCVPLGIATYATEGEITSVRWRRFAAAP